MTAPPFGRTFWAGALMGAAFTGLLWTASSQAHRQPPPAPVALDPCGGACIQLSDAPNDIVVFGNTFTDDKASCGCRDVVR